MDKTKYQLLPDLLPEEYDFLKASIDDHGVEVPIIVDQDGEVVDGFHRQRVCDELGTARGRFAISKWRQRRSSLPCGSTAAADS